MQIQLLAGDTDDLIHTLDPERTAMLGIHWQKGTTDPDDPFGQVFGPIVERLGLIDRVRAVFAAARGAGIQVIHINICNPPDMHVNTPIFKHAEKTGGLRCGSPEVALRSEVYDPADIQIDHHRPSAFTGTGLDALLKERGIDTLVLTGLATNVAVESTARQAADEGYYVVVLSDCCIAGSKERHVMSIENMKVLTTRVMQAQELFSELPAPLAVQADDPS